MIPYHRYRKVGIAAVIFIVALALLWLARGPLLQCIGEGLSVESVLSDERDGAIVLMGSIDDRSQAAAQLYHRKKVRRILLATPELTDLARAGLIPDEAQLTAKLLEFYGVPGDAIKILVVPGTSPNTSTREEAVFFRQALAADPSLGSSFYVVTSWYHSRRARWIFERVLAGTDIEMSFVAAPNERSSPKNWWMSEQGFLAVFNEYLKWLHSMCHGYVRP